MLAQRAQRVVAVDPAALDPCLLSLPNVTHLACKARPPLWGGGPGLAARAACAGPSRAGGSPRCAALPGARPVCRPRLLACLGVQAEDAVQRIHELAGEKGIDLLVSGGWSIVHGSACRHGMAGAA